MGNARPQRRQVELVSDGAADDARQDWKGRIDCSIVASMVKPDVASTLSSIDETIGHNAEWRERLRHRNSARNCAQNIYRSLTA
jgi:hypothetical protein